MFGVFFFQAEDGIRDLVRSRGLGDVYKRQGSSTRVRSRGVGASVDRPRPDRGVGTDARRGRCGCLLYTSDAADERSSVDLGGRRIIKKKKQTSTGVSTHVNSTTEHRVDGQDS